MSETLLIVLIAAGFGTLVFFGSKYFMKKTGTNISPWIWAGAAAALVFLMKFCTDGFLDIGSK